jgi:hypothetical protein
MGSAFTQVLANIYMLEWKQDLIKHQEIHHEIYGRLVKKTILNRNKFLLWNISFVADTSMIFL